MKTKVWVVESAEELRTSSPENQVCSVPAVKLAAIEQNPNITVPKGAWLCLRRYPGIASTSTKQAARMVVDNSIWLLTVDSQPVGVLVLIDEPDDLLVYSVAFELEFQKQGLGRPRPGQAGLLRREEARRVCASPTILNVLPCSS